MYFLFVWSARAALSCFRRRRVLLENCVVVFCFCLAFFLDLDILSIVAWCARTSFVYFIFSVVRTLCSPAV